MILEDLNDEQKKAVCFDDHLLLTACPGSGKTRVISHIIAYELGRLNSLNRRIVALTFTIRAAEEIERRLHLMEIETSRLWSGNIHAFCLNWILRPYAGFHPRTQRGFVIIDAVKTNEILEVLLQKDDYSIIREDFKFNSPIVKIQPNGSFIVKKPTHMPLFEAYRTELEINRFVDFEHLLFYSLELLRSCPKIAVTLSGVFQNILIDEFQDTQELQYQIIFEIVTAGRGRTKVSFVGDCDQAIFSSLGGVAKSKEEIEAGIKAKVESLDLSGNYRSNQRVINYYRNFQTTPIEITARSLIRDNPGKITLNKTLKRENLADEIAKLIQQSLNQGIVEEEIGILVPQWLLILPLARKLKHLLPGVSFDASGIAPMSDSRDNLFYKIARLFLTAPSQRLYKVRQRWATEIGLELALSIGCNQENPQFSARQVLKIVNSIQSSETQADPYLRECLTNFLFAFHVKISDFPALSISFESYFRGIQRRIERAKKEGDPLPEDIESFRNFYREATGVVISTVHGAKGEEYETIIAFGLLKGFLPHWNDIIDKSIDENDVSRKLLYVICSRAKNNLHLIMEGGRTTRKGDPLEFNNLLSNLQFEYDEP
ncbi:UvrD-helicase domain-containing protein [Haliscomenobacter hydrossis]|uniref:DNA 3'-5' helicase n=1 Tax=Haliscomenobacter hydrossis (strain ATCC 27775 / DSM 1100 / LMG 10767 / O) TaxID=760192 RepID=F4KVN7_HALH1|nr:ATP-dependent helicase [Haliscomenobacter hydrossis]AEE52494.1 UvrD/REP helicase [Haliscomenobacter hydrossis DSM 1100]